MFRAHRFVGAVLVAFLTLVGLSPIVSAKSQAGVASLTGTLQKVDGQTLTIQTSKGLEMVMLGNGVQVRRSGKTIPMNQLAGESGSRVTVRYLETGGHKEARSVTLAARK
jgi:hypothetical protein